MDTYPIQVKTVFDDNDKTIKNKTHFNTNTKDFDSVIDKCIESIEMFPNTMHINKGYAIAQSDIDETMFIPTPKMVIKNKQISDCVNDSENN